MVAGGAYAVYALASKRLLEDGHAPEDVMAALFGLGARCSRTCRRTGWRPTMRPLVARLERDGVGVLRAHLRQSAETPGAASVDQNRADGKPPSARR